MLSVPSGKYADINKAGYFGHVILRHASINDAGHRACHPEYIVNSPGQFSIVQCT
jgi:hypothetical protein